MVQFRPLANTPCIEIGQANGAYGLGPFDYQSFTKMALTLKKNQKHPDAQELFPHRLAEPG